LHHRWVFVLRGSEAILPDRFSSQSTEKTINLVWARKALSISSIQFLSLKESEDIFPDPIEGSQALQIRSQIAPDHRQAQWSSESRSPRGIAAGTALERRPPEDLPESGRPICIAALRPQKKKQACATRAPLDGDGLPPGDPIPRVCFVPGGPAHPSCSPGHA
jgi:hypothetical protein